MNTTKTKTNNLSSNLKALGCDRLTFYYVNRTSNDDEPTADLFRYSVACLWNGHTLVSRGIAICSPDDVYQKKLGRKLALHRAFQAAARKQNSELISNSRGCLIVASKLFGYNKSAFMPRPTVKESELIERQFEYEAMVKQAN